MNSSSRAVNAGYTIATLMLAFVVAFTCFEVVSIGVGIARGGESLMWGDSLTVPAQLNPDAIRGLHDGVTFSGRPDVQLHVEDPSTKLMLFRSLMDLGPLLLLVAVLTLLRGLARSIKDGDPFGEANIRRLRRIGVLVVGGALVLAFVNGWLREGIFDNLPRSYGDVGVDGFELPVNALLAGLGLYVLAEVFSYGLTLREDVESTI